MHGDVTGQLVRGPCRSCGAPPPTVVSRSRPLTSTGLQSTVTSTDLGSKKCSCMCSRLEIVRLAPCEGRHTHGDIEDHAGAHRHSGIRDQGICSFPELQAHAEADVLAQLVSQVPLPLILQAVKQQREAPSITVINQPCPLLAADLQVSTCLPAIRGRADEHVFSLGLVCNFWLCRGVAHAATCWPPFSNHTCSRH